MDVRRAAEPDMSTYLGINMTPVLGSLFWGTLVSMMMTGMTILQAYRYFPSKDRALVQSIALSMVLLELLSSSLTAHALYTYLLPNFGSTIPLGRLVPTLAAECVVTSCIIVISQLYFAWQVYRLAQKSFVKYAVSCAVVVLSFLAFVGGIGCSIVMFVHATHILTTRSRVFIIMAAIAKAPAALADTIATFSLCYSLGFARTGERSTDSVIKTLIGFAIQRGVLVTMVQAAFLVVFYFSSSHLYWLGLHVNMTRVYSNTFFAMLNARETLKKELERKSRLTSGGFETYSRSHLYSSFHEQNKGAGAIEVPRSMRVDTIKGGNPLDTPGIMQIQVGQRVVVSNR